MPYVRIMDENAVHYQWHGKITRDDLLAISHELPEVADQLGYAPNVLHTFAESTYGRVDPWTLFEHSIRRRNTRLRNRAKVAWVAAKPDVLLVARMFKELNRNPDIVIEIFPDEEPARKWLADTLLAEPAVKRRRATPARRAAG